MWELGEWVAFNGLIIFKIIEMKMGITQKMLWTYCTSQPIHLDSSEETYKNMCLLNRIILEKQNKQTLLVSLNYKLCQHLKPGVD